MCIDELGNKSGTCACDRPPTKIYSPDNVSLIYEAPYLKLDEDDCWKWVYFSDEIETIKNREI